MHGNKLYDIFFFAVGEQVEFLDLACSEENNSGVFFDWLKYKSVCFLKTTERARLPLKILRKKYVLTFGGTKL